MVSILELFKTYLYNERYIAELKRKRDMLDFSEIDGYENIGQVLTGMPHASGTSDKTGDTAIRAIEQREKADLSRQIIDRTILKQRQDMQRVDEIINSIDDIILFTILNEKTRKDKTFSYIAELDVIKAEYLSEEAIEMRYYRYIDKIDKERQKIEDEIEKELTV